MSIKFKDILNVTFLLVHIVLLILFFKADEKHFIASVFVTAIIFLMYIFLEYKYDFYINNYARGCIIITVLAHHVMGEYFYYYFQSFVFDNLLHVFGAYSLTIFIYSLMVHFLRLSIESKRNKFIFIALLGISLGAGFEIVEFLIDSILELETPLQLGLIDTNLDMVSDLIGGLIAALHICFLDDGNITSVKKYSDF